MRAVLVVNPTATATTARARDVLAHALSSELKLEVATTTHRGHATEIAAKARAEGVDLVVALGGDGTSNEVINGLLAAGGPAEEVPALAVVPGGSTNVFARSLGLTNDALEATGQLLELLAAGTTRTIGLGQANGRHFGFCAGLGFDARIVRAVEAKRAKGVPTSHSLFARVGLMQYFLREDRRTPTVTVTWDGAESPVEVFYVIATNTSPWTYFGKRPIVSTAGTSFDAGIGIFGMRRFAIPIMSRASIAAMTRPLGARGKHVLSLPDIAAATLTCTEPTPWEVDGDDCGDTTKLELRSIPNALRVLAPTKPS